MIDFIQGEFKKIILKCCGKNEGDVVLVLGLDEDGQNTYTIINYIYDYETNQMVGYDWSKQKSLTINDVLGVKIDFMGYGLLSEPFIQKSILRFANKYSLPYERVSMYCFPTTSEVIKNDKYVYDADGNVKMQPDVDIFLYDGRSESVSKYLETITFADLFKEEDMVLPT